LAPPHIPILAGTDCSACHGAAYTAGGFGPATAMSAATHAFVSATCDTCHETGKSFYVGSGTPLQLRPADHANSSDPRMATGDCSLCHETKDWVSNNLPAGHMPNPANLNCTQCHASAPADYTPATLAANSALHTGITGNCGQCHGNNVSALTWFDNFTPKDAILAPSHIPYLSGTDCSSCHASSTYAAGTFGPMNMTQAKHAFVPGSCNTCHEAGLNFFMGAANPVLQGRPADHTSGQMVAPNDCSLCHTTANWNSTALPAGHMPNPANQQCTVCHTAAPGDYTAATLAALPVLHTGITSGCGQCHGATTALTWYNNYTPKDGILTPAHIPYSNGADCSSCHAPTYATGGFGPTNMNAAKHAFVPVTCDTCHEAGLSFYLGASTPALQGRPQDHTATPSIPQQVSGDCNLCHVTSTWVATALPAGHMPNPAGEACTVCHTAAPTNYNAYASVQVLHTGITNGCAQCHGGTTALTFYNQHDNPKAAASLSPPHIPAFTGEDCSSCHTTNYVVGGFGPMNMTQATHAGVGSTCNGCHEAGLNFYMGAASPGLQGRPADHTSGTMAAPNDCSLCHSTANWNSTALPAGHMPNPANTACATCHTSAPTDYTTATLAANSILHTGITGGCGQCHGGSTALTWYNNFTPKDAILTPSHIPYLSGTDCSACHGSATYAAGTFGPMYMTQAKHAFVATTCVTCHEAGVRLYMGAASPALQGRPADHTSGTMMAPNDCGLCHTTANWNSTALPSGHMPNPANQACAVCHTKAPSDYTTTTLAANPVLHTGITTGCIGCHGAPNAAAPVFYPSYTPKDAILSPVHIPTGATPCEKCHTKAIPGFASFSGAAMNSALHAAMFAYIGSTCDACHNKVTPALSFYGVSNLQTRPSNHNSGNKATEDCSACHSPSNWDNAQVRKTVAAPATTRAQIATVVAASAVSAHMPNAGKGSRRSFAPEIAVGVSGRAMPSHAGVTANCANCHNGVLAPGKGAMHIASNDACENCHVVSAWLPARFEHRGVTATCASCHNGVLASAKPARHIQATQDCRSCHGVLAWTPARFDHVGLVAACRSCHNGVTATGKQVQHVVTTADCSSCHSTLNWTVLNASSPPPLRPLLSPRIPKPRGTPTSPIP
jgi:cytochrome c553